MIPTQIFLKIYIGVCSTVSIYGMFKGFCKWTKWLNCRNRVTINNEIVDSTLNIGRDGGVLGCYLISSGLMSLLITATFPISIPLLSMFAKPIPCAQATPHNE